jgi:hypothetical protein
MEPIYLTPIQQQCFNDWAKYKRFEMYAPNGLEEVFVKQCKQPEAYTPEFIRGWEYGRNIVTGLIDHGLCKEMAQCT